MTKSTTKALSAFGMQFTRFAAAGVVGTAFHYLVLLVLVDVASVPVAVGTLAGFTVGAVTNYLLARSFVFVTRRPHSVALPRFAAIAIVGAFANTAIVQVIYQAGVHYLIAQVCATLCVLVWNYVANRLWTFNS